MKKTIIALTLAIVIAAATGNALATQPDTSQAVQTPLVEAQRLTLISSISPYLRVSALSLATISALAGVNDKVEYGVNDGILWYAGYKGAYTKFLTTDGLHYAQAKVLSNGTWVSDRTTAAGGNWANADTGLQPSVTNANHTWGLGS